MAEIIRLTWEEWQRERARRRAVMRDFAVDQGSRRKNAAASQEIRLRRAFNGARAPNFEGLSSSARRPESMEELK